MSAKDTGMNDDNTHADESVQSTSLEPASANQAAATAASANNELVTNVGANDVLMGRGAPSTEYEGNVRFRNLVLERREEYMSVDKRKDKHRIAREIVRTIRSRGGRFLLRDANERGAESLVRPREGVAWRNVPDSPSLFVKVNQSTESVFAVFRSFVANFSFFVFR